MVLLKIIGILCKEIAKTMEEINKNIILLIDNSNKIAEYTKPIIYTKQGRDDFAKDIKETCDKGLIRPSKSTHSTFMLKIITK